MFFLSETPRDYREFRDTNKNKQSMKQSKNHEFIYYKNGLGKHVSLSVKEVEVWPRPRE